MRKDSYKGDVLPPPPFGKSTGHGLLKESVNESIIIDDASEYN